MEKIRKGNTTNILWEIVTRGSEIPYELTGKDLTLYLRSPFKKEKISQFSVSGNAISWTYQGKDQIHSGVYSLMLVENEGKDNMFTADKCDAFELVDCSHLEGGESESHVSIETVSLKSAISVNAIKVDQELNEDSPNPISNSAVTKGLKDKVNKVEGMGLSSNDYTDDDKEKLDSLENYDDSGLWDKVNENEGYISQLSGSMEEVRGYISELDTKVEGKANPDGTYPNMTVGLADDLGGRPYYDESEFTFRATAGSDTSIKDGLAEITKLHGNSVVWNQKARKYYLNQSASELRLDDGIPQGHIFLMTRTVATGELWYLPQADLYAYYLNIGQYGKIMTCNHTEDKSFVRMYATDESGYVQLIDLTLMFGAGNEPTTIEEYNARKPIVSDEYEYNEGEVIHMTAEGIKSVGDNAWDEEWELGYIDPTTGKNKEFENYIRGKNFNRIIGGQDYYLIGKNFNIVLYDKNYQWIDFWGALGEPRMVHIDDRARYFKMSFKIDYGTTYKNDAFVSLYHSGWKAEDAKYQPYWEDRLMFDKRIKDAFPDGMQKWDMVYNKNGKGYIVKGSCEVDLGSQSWEKAPEGWYQINFNMLKNDGRLISPYHACPINYLTAGDMSIASVSQYVVIRDSRYTDAAAFKAAMAGVPLWYELADEYKEVIEYDEPFNLDYKVADFGTEEIIASKPSAPIKTTIQYNFNANDTIRTNKIAIRNLERKITELTTLLSQIAVKVKEVE